MKTNCKICNREIDISLNRFNKSKSKVFTCSKKCMGISFRRKNNLKCPICNKEFSKKPSDINKTKNICCSYNCAYELKKITSLGNNKKYIFNERFFGNIDSESKAWVLGWIASDGSICKDGSISIVLHQKDINVICQIQKIMCKDLPIYKKNHNQYGITFCSKTMVGDICKHLKINPGKKSKTVRLPENIGEFGWHFLRGYFEGDGNIRTPSCGRAPECKITSNSINMLNDISEFCGIPNNINSKHGCISWSGVNCLDFLGNIYKNCNFYMLRKFETYNDWAMWTSIHRNNRRYIDKIFFAKTKESAILPSKKRVSDSGYDLTLIEEVKRYGDVVFYDTGIKINPPFGYYFDLVPRSSISKSGYILANNIGIIDRSYIGSIIVPLLKIDKLKPDLELPCKLVQLIPRAIEHFEIVEVPELSETERGEGGFGSTGTR